MNMIIFCLSPAQSDKLRRYCEQTGADMNGLACDAVRCMMDLIDDDADGLPWTPKPDGLATSADVMAWNERWDDSPGGNLARGITEAVLCALTGRQTSAQIAADAAVDAMFGTGRHEVAA